MHNKNATRKLRMQDLIKKIFLIGLLIYSLGAIVYIDLNTAGLGYQHDFRVYYFSAEVLSGGNNPYDPHILRPLAKTSLYCAYPPFALFFYKMFLPLDFLEAANVFIFFKTALLIILVLFWKKYFIGEKNGVLFYVFCLLAFNRTIYIDLIAGNISLIEQFLLWIAFYFFLKNRLFLFSSFVLLSSLFKLTPIVFLFLLVLTSHPKRIRYFFIFIFIFALYLLIQAQSMPFLFGKFLAHAMFTTSEVGNINPSTFALIHDIFRLINMKLGIAISPWVPKIIALFLNLFVIGVFVYVFRKIMSSNIKNKKKIILFLFCLLYALIHPRFKDYSHILLIVPAYFILTKPLPIKAIGLLFAFFFIPFTTFLPGEKVFWNIFFEYYSLVLVYATCGLYYYAIFNCDPKIFESRDTS